MPNPLSPVALDTQLASKTNSERSSGLATRTRDNGSRTMNDPFPRCEKEGSTTTSPAGLCSRPRGGPRLLQATQATDEVASLVDPRPHFRRAVQKPCLDGLRTRGSSVAEANAGLVRHSYRPRNSSVKARAL